MLGQPRGGYGTIIIAWRASMRRVRGAAPFFALRKPGQLESQHLQGIILQLRQRLFESMIGGVSHHFLPGGVVRC